MQKRKKGAVFTWPIRTLSFLRPPRGGFKQISPAEIRQKRFSSIFLLRNTGNGPMTDEMNSTSIVLDLALIGEFYGRFRLVHPQAEHRMVESMRRYGQLMPVIVSIQDERCELVDGFKRLRAARRLGFCGLTAKTIEATPRVAKACIIQLNRKGGFITDLEEAMVCESLYREDRLAQLEIATLLGRHKSWVSRRLSLIQRLGEDAVNHLRLGLITSSIGRELARLPRGNQKKVLDSILKHRLCSRQCQQLVSLLLQRPRWEHDNILYCPGQTLATIRPFSGRKSKKLQDSAAEIYGQLCAIKKSFDKWLAVDLPFTNQESQYLLAVMDQLELQLQDFRQRLV